jgi:hypothetical protein
MASGPQSPLSPLANRARARTGLFPQLQLIWGNRPRTFIEAICSGPLGCFAYEAGPERKDPCGGALLQG